MSKQLQVKFVKGIAELAVQEGETAMGRNQHDESYIYRANDGNAYLMATKGQGQVTRFHFCRDDVSGRSQLSSHGRGTSTGSTGPPGR